ncbi:unnamed protein product, partial [Closterium sp. NIES-53]
WFCCSDHLVQEKHLCVRHWPKSYLYVSKKGDYIASCHCSIRCKVRTLTPVCRYQTAHLIEVNAHSLFSKWFSESAKLVSKLFSHIQSFVEDKSSLVFVLIDEVESLAAARQAALNGSDPSDAIRVVNALLTQLDKLKQHPNVMVLTTSNLTHAIDLAFIDRADIKAFIGPPSLQGRYYMLHSSFCELQRVGIVDEVEGNTVYPSTYNELMLSDCDSEDMGSSKGVHLGKKLLEVAKACE